MKIHTYFDGVDVEGPVDEMLAKMERENKRAVLCPHIFEDGTKVYRIRALMEPLPDKLQEFVGHAPDPSKVIGLVNYHGFVAENVVTSGTFPSTHFPTTFHSRFREDAWRVWGLYLRGDERMADAWHLAEKIKDDVGGVLRAAMLLVCAAGGSFPRLAEASIVAPLPEVHFDLAVLACGVGGVRSDQYFRPEEVLRQVGLGVDLASNGIDILPWRWDDRVLLPAKLGARAALQLGLEDEAAKWAGYGLRSFPDDSDLKGLLVRTQRYDKKLQPVIRGRGLPDAMEKALTTETTAVACLYPIVVVNGAGEEPPEAGQFAVFFDNNLPPVTDYEAINCLYACAGVVPLSFFQWKELKRRYPFLPNITRHMSMGFDPLEPLQKDVDVVFVDNEVTGAIIQRVYAGIPDRAIHCLSRPTTNQIASSRVFLDAPLTPPAFHSAVLQAQSAECVPVVAGVGCLPELVKGGYFYQPPVTSEASIQAAADRIVHLLNHEDERKQIALDGAARVRAEFSWEVLALKWKRLLRAGGREKA